MIGFVYKMMIEEMMRKANDEIIAKYKKLGIDIGIEVKVKNIDFDKLAEYIEKIHTTNIAYTANNSPVQSDNEQDMFSALNTDSNIELFEKLFGGKR